MSRIYRTCGIVAMTPKGEYDSSAYYERLNVVTYNGSSYVAIQNTHGNLPTNTTYWQLLAHSGVAYATADRPANATNGAMIFDTTLNKPIWKYGTKWYDATGTQV